MDSAQAALAQWEAIKQRERKADGRERSVLDGVPVALPALTRAQRMQSKAARVRFDWPDAAAAWAKVEEEMDEAKAALASGDAGARSARSSAISCFPSSTWRGSPRSTPRPRSRARSKSFGGASREMETALAMQGRSVTAVDQDELERSWEATKARERQG